MPLKIGVKKLRDYIGERAYIGDYRGQLSEDDKGFYLRHYGRTVRRVRPDDEIRLPVEGTVRGRKYQVEL